MLSQNLRPDMELLGKIFSAILDMKNAKKMLNIFIENIAKGIMTRFSTQR